MLENGPAKRVSIYIGEDHTYQGRAVYLAVLEYLFNRGVSRASAVRGIAGFGADHHLHTIAIERLTENLPIKIQFIESESIVKELLPELHKMVGTGLIEFEDTVVQKRPVALSGASAVYEGSLGRKGRARLMRICIYEHDMWRGRPLYQALVECLRANGIAGVTVYQGWLELESPPHTGVAHFFHPSHRRPMTLAVIEKEETLESILAVLEEMITEGIVALSEVEVIRYVHDFQSTERRKRPRSDGEAHPH